MDIIQRLLAVQPYRFVLPNGLVCIFLPCENNDLMALQLWVKTGTLHENKYLGSGISHFVEHMVFKGTEKRTFLDIFSETQHKGATLNAYTTFDRTVYTFDGPKEALDTGLSLLADIVFHPTFPAEEFQKERDVVLREINMANDDPEDQLSQRVLETTFKVHPYRYPILGIRNIFEQLTRNNLHDYWAKRYIPNNTTLVLVGPFEAEHIHTALSKGFGGYEPKSLEPIILPSEPFQLGEREERFYGNYHLVRGAITFKIPGIGHKDTASLNVLANILGSGYSAILYQKLREELRLVHDIEASCWTGDDEGLFWIQYVCDTEKRANVEKFITQELKSIATAGISAERLKKALNQAICSEIDARKTVHGQAHHLGWAEVVIGDINYPRFYLEQLKSLTPRTVESVVEKYFKPQMRTCVSLEPSYAKKKPNILSSKPSNRQKFNIQELPNNLRLIYQHCPHFPKTHIKTLCLGGTHYEASKNRGIFQLLSTLLTKDTKQNDSKTIAETLESLGGHFIPFITNNSFGLNLEVLSSEVKTGVQILEASLTEPLLKTEIFNREKTAQIAAIKDSLDDVFNVGFQEMRKLFFKRHPYAIGPIGTERSVKSTSHSDVLTLFKRSICGSNIVFSVVSSCSLEEILPLLAPIAAKISQHPFNVKELENYGGPNKPQTKTIYLGKEQALVFQSYPLCGLKHTDFYATEVVEELLNGLSSEFVIQVREKLGLSYTVGANRLLGLETGMLCLFAGTREPYLALIEQEMGKAISRIRNGKISKKEFENCHTRLMVRHRTRMQSIGKRAADAGFKLLYDYPEKDCDAYEKQLRKVSLDQIVSVANQYLTENKACTLFVSSKKSA